MLGVRRDDVEDVCLFRVKHPLEGGALRFKFRRDRRPGFPMVPVWRFYPMYLAETFAKLGRWLGLYLRLRLTWERIKRDPRRFEYTDLAVTPVQDDERETRDLFLETRTA